MQGTEDFPLAVCPRNLFLFVLALSGSAMICIIFVGSEGLSFLWSDLKDQFVATRAFYVGVSPPHTQWGRKKSGLCAYQPSTFPEFLSARHKCSNTSKILAVNGPPAQCQK